MHMVSPHFLELRIHRIRLNVNKKYLINNKISQTQ
nr:MAG TPA: hypothetical protein [Caudoviricetes sp.]